MLDGPLSSSSCLVVGLHVYKDCMYIRFCSLLCMEKKMGRLLETHCLAPYTLSSTKIKPRNIHGYNNKDEQSLGVDFHIVCHTFNFAFLVWLLFFDFAICSVCFNYICCNGYFIFLHHCITQNIMATTVQYVLYFKFFLQRLQQHVSICQKIFCLGH